LTKFSKRASKILKNKGSIKRKIEKIALYVIKLLKCSKKRSNKNKKIKNKRKRVFKNKNSLIRKTQNLIAQTTTPALTQSFIAKKNRSDSK